MRCKALVQALIPYTSGDTDLVTADAARGCLLQLGHLKDKAAVAAADNSADAAGNDALVSEYSVSLGLMLHSVGCNSALPPPPSSIVLVLDSDCFTRRLYYCTQGQTGSHTLPVKQTCCLMTMYEWQPL